MRCFILEKAKDNYHPESALPLMPLSNCYIKCIGLYHFVLNCGVLGQVFALYAIFLEVGSCMYIQTACEEARCPRLASSEER